MALADTSYIPYEVETCIIAFAAILVLSNYYHNPKPHEPFLFLLLVCYHSISSSISSYRVLLN